MLQYDLRPIVSGLSATRLPNKLVIRVTAKSTHGLNQMVDWTRKYLSDRVGGASTNVEWGDYVNSKARLESETAVTITARMSYDQDPVLMFMDMYEELFVMLNDEEQEAIYIEVNDDALIISVKDNMDFLFK